MKYSSFHLDCFGYLEYFELPYETLFFSSSIKNGIGILVGVSLNLLAVFHNVAISTILVFQLMSMGAFSIFYYFYLFPSSVYFSIHCRGFSPPLLSLS